MKKILLSALLCGLMPIHALAADADTELRLQRLEAQISQLQNRIVLLERALSQSSNSGIGNNTYESRLSPYATTYKGESDNQGRAKRQAQQACLRDHQMMFCQTEQIRCDRY